MNIELIAVGGFGEVGKNMTALRVDDDVILLDMGLHMPNYIKFTQGEDERAHYRMQDLIAAQAIPDIALMKEWKSKVRAIVISHAHLDHVGAAPYLANEFNAPIMGTPYTMSVFKALLRDTGTKIRNKIITIPLNGRHNINKDLSLEFINVTHSIPHQCFVAIHTKYGIVLYALDFKFDNNPVVGDKPNYAALKRIGDKGVVLAMVDSLYAHEEKKTPSESVVKEMLRDVMMGTYSKGNAVIVTTFASHIARLKTITEFGRQLGRKVVFLGRSLDKYVTAAEEIKLIDFRKSVFQRGKYSSQSKSILKKIEKEGADKYLLVVTGHQGEPRSMLRKLAGGQLPFKFKAGDQVIFSSNVIPHPQNVLDRQNLEAELRAQGVRIFRDIHVSGHPCREDLYEFFRLVRPQHVIPAHAEHDRVDKFVEFANGLGFVRGRTVHELFTGQRFGLPPSKHK